MDKPSLDPPCVPCNLWFSYKCVGPIVCFCIVHTSGLFLCYRVLVGAVDKSQLPLKLNFFNNCFDNEFSKRECATVILGERKVKAVCM